MARMGAPRNPVAAADDYIHVVVVCPFNPEIKASYEWLRARVVVNRLRVPIERLSTGNWSYSAQHNGERVKIWLRKTYDDPEGRAGHILVMCDNPASSRNELLTSSEILKHPDVTSKNPRFQILQDFVFLRANGDCYGPQGIHTWNFLNALPDRTVVEAAINEIYQRCSRAGISMDFSVSAVPLARNQSVDIAHYILKGGTSLAYDLLVVRYIGKLVAKENGLVVFDPNLIPGFYKEAGMRMMFSTLSMRSPGGYEEVKVGLNKLIMMNALSGEDNDNEFKVVPYQDALMEADGGRGRPRVGAIEIQMLPSSLLTDPSFILAGITSSVILWQPSIQENLKAEFYRNPMLKAARLTLNKFMR